MLLYMFLVSLDSWGYQLQCEHNRLILLFTNLGYKEGHLSVSQTLISRKSSVCAGPPHS